MRLIDADALIDNLAKAIPYFIDDAVTEAYVEGLDRARCEIDNSPTVEPERKKGKWIDEGQYAEGHSHHAYCCSECEGQIIEYEPYPFCPWCGADMNKRNKRNKEENKWVSEIHNRLMDETGGKAVCKNEHWGKGDNNE